MLLSVEDPTWQGVLRLRRAALECLDRLPRQVAVDLRGLAAEGSNAFWLAALVSLRRLLATRGCELVLVSPPAPLVAALLRLHLEVAHPPGS